MNFKVDGLIGKIVTLPYFKDFLKVLLVLLLTVPLLFINIRKDIDWGDDNAHYLLQAKYIAQGVPQANTQYIYNSNCPVLGPPAYPIGFPLMLSGVYYVKGLNLHAFNLIMTMALIILCLLMVLYYKNTHRFLTSVFLVLIVAYNPWTLSFKSEIMSEIPFAVILLATVLLYKKFNNISTYIIIGVLCGYLISIRTIGVVLPLAIFAETTRNFLLAFLRKEKGLTKTLRHNLLKLGIIITFCFGIYFLLNTVIFKIKFDASSGYFAIFSFRGLGNIILQNLAYYFDVLETFFNPKNGKWVFLSLITKSCVFTMIMLGWLKKIYKDFGLADFLVVFYLLVLLIYPYHQSGFRFLFPLLPFLMSYAVQGLKTIHLGFNPKTSVKVVLLGSLVLVQYYYGFNEMVLLEIL